MNAPRGTARIAVSLTSLFAIGRSSAATQDAAGCIFDAPSSVASTQQEANMPSINIDALPTVGTARIRAKATDPHEGLRGHDYIAARGLNQQVRRLPPDAPMLAQHQASMPSLVHKRKSA